MTTLLQQKKIIDCPVNSFCTSQGIHIFQNETACDKIHPT